MKIFKLILLQTFWYYSIRDGSNLFFPIIGFLLFFIDYFVFKKIERLHYPYLYFSFLLVLSGITMDKALNLLGVINWGNQFYPYELIGVWLIFPTYYYQFFKKFQGAIVLTFFAGLIFGPLAYYSGGNLNSIISLSTTTWKLIIMGVSWGLFFSGSIHFSKKLCT